MCDLVLFSMSRFQPCSLQSERIEFFNKGDLRSHHIPHLKLYSIPLMPEQES